MFKTKAKTICGANIAKVTLSLDVQKKKRKGSISKIWLELVGSDYTRHFFLLRQEKDLCSSVKECVLPE